jgi:Fe-S-cluster containining protein
MDFVKFMSNERPCGDCTVCCVVPKITDIGFEKDRFEKCKFCKINRGCSVYDKRPQACSAFSCLWKMNFTHESKRPDKSGIMIDLLPANSGKETTQIFVFYEYKEGAFKSKFFRDAVEICQKYNNNSHYPIILFRKNKKPVLFTDFLRNTFLGPNSKFMLDGFENEVEVRSIKEILNLD